MDKISGKRDEQGRVEKTSKIAPNTMTKLAKNEFVSMLILDKICKTLGTDYGDIMEYMPENQKQMANYRM